MKTEPWLRLDQLTVKRGGKTVLENVDLEIDHGEFVVILGANGSGKSTLLAALLGQVPIASGAIHVAGENLESMSVRERAHWFAWLPQESHSPEAILVEEVVAAARYHLDEPRPVSLEKSREALEDSGAGDLARRWWTELSGGERQRVEIATLRAQSTPAWLLDEPVNHLDPLWRERLLVDLQEKAISGQTVIVVLHDMHLIKEISKIQTRVIALSEGKVILDSPDASALEDDARDKIYGETHSGKPVLQTENVEGTPRKSWSFLQMFLWCVVTLCAGFASAWIGPTLEGELGDKIFSDLRVPRALVGLSMGAVLAGAGAVLQILLQNPLATPGTVGTTAGASLGVIIALLSGTVLQLGGFPLLPLAAFVGAMGVTALVATVAARSRTRTEDVLLAGIALTLMTGAISSALRLGFDQVMALDALRWSLGSLSLISYDRWILAAPFFGISLVGMLTLLRPLDVLATGSERAASRGVNVPRIRTLGVGLSSLGVAAGVATCGPIAFVGLICPHVMRILGGGQPRFLVPASMMFGAAFLPLCDGLGRIMLQNRDVPVGVITASLGAPVLFLLVLRRSRRV
ncbi:MAG: iron chelate uptake ABC transporter family permease subunit [Planctomycetia bacterium]|nr:iron chelate uptake ABC transporter family permease subunit [Planctomycetia bacterium]